MKSEYSNFEQVMNRVQPVLIFALRAGLGLVLGLIAAVLAAGTAWGLYVFSSSTSLTALLYLLISSTGVAAGIGAFFAWLRMDRNSLPLSLLTVTLAMAAGFGGAWGGHSYGLTVEGPCCVEPEIEPMSYAVLGATVMANGALVLVGLVREIIDRKPTLILRLFRGTAGTPN